MARPALTPLIATLYEMQASSIEPRLKKLGIGWTTFQLLSAVRGAGSEASQAEIARRLGITAATLSESVTEHVGKGLLSQNAGIGDRRVKVLKLTAKADRVLTEVMDILQETERKMTEGIGEQTLKTCASTLEKCLGNLDNLSGS